MKLNPIFGVGFGNWKFKSIDYDKKNMVGYTVPYHAHSDFIQLGAELGILGFLLYSGFFLFSPYFILVKAYLLTKIQKMMISYLYI